MVQAIYAGITVIDLERARAWYARVFGREPDAAPMDGLYEWHLGEHCLQVVALERVREIQNLPNWGAPGASSVTLVVDDAQAAAQEAIAVHGSAVSHFENPRFQTASVADPEGNLVTFLQIGARM
jgi:hypothetical protein